MMNGYRHNFSATYITYTLTYVFVAFLCFLFFEVQTTHAGITHVQEFALGSSFGSTLTATTTVSVSPGNTLVVFIRQSGSAVRTYSVSDNVGGTTGWVQAVSTTSSSRYVEVWYRNNIPPGVTLVSVTHNQGTTGFVTGVAEFTGFGSTVTVATTSSRLDSVPRPIHHASNDGISSDKEVLAAVVGVALATFTDGTPGVGYTETPEGDVSTTGIFQWQVFAAGSTTLEAWTLRKSMFDDISTSTATQDGNPQEIAFSPDGSNMYIAGSSGAKIYQYSLGTPWNVSTATFVASTSVSSQEATPWGVYMSATGTRMWVIGGSADRVFQYDLGVAWDITSASYNNASTSVSSQDASPSAVQFSSDGMKMYILGGSNDRIFQYSMNASFDLTVAASYDSISTSSSAQDSDPNGLTFNASGTKAYILGRTNDRIYEYELGTAWDVSTMEHRGNSYRISNQETNGTGVTFKPDGLKFYMTGSTNDLVNQYSITAEAGIWDNTGLARQAISAMTLLAGSSDTDLTISGTLYTDEGVTTDTATRTIGVAVGGSDRVYYTTSSTTGEWTAYVASTSIATGTPIVVWVAGDETTRATTFTKASTTGNSISGLDLYQNRVIVSHEGTSGTSTTISDMAFYDFSNGTSIQYDVATTTNTLTVFSNQELLVKAGKTFAPGGNVTINANGSTTSATDGNLHIAEAATYTAGGTTKLGGSWYASTSATFSFGGFTTVFNATTTGKVINSLLTTTLGHLLFTGASSTYAFINNATTTDFYINTSATVTAPTLLTVEGNYVNTGGFIHNDGTLRMASTSAHTISGQTGTSSAFSDLTIAKSGAVAFSNIVKSATTTTMEGGFSGDFESGIVDEKNNALYLGYSTYNESFENVQIIYKCVLSTGCDDGDDFVVATTSVTEGTISAFTIDSVNEVLYAGTAGFSSAGYIYRCALSTGCDGGADFVVATATPATYMNSMVVDTASGTLYVATNNSGIIYRCALSTGCDGGADFVIGTNTPMTSITSLVLDATNGTLYAGGSEDGVIYRCSISTGCDGSGDYTVATNTAESTINSLTIDTTSRILYAGGGPDGYIYRCELTTGCDSVGDFTTVYNGAGLSTYVYSLHVDPISNVLLAGAGSAGYSCDLSTGCDAYDEFATSSDNAYISYDNHIFTYNGKSYLDGSTQLNVCTFCHGSHSTTTVMADVNIESDASFTHNQEMRISGDYTNNGTSTSSTDNGASIVVFTGSSAQAISGTLTATSSFGDMTFIGGDTKTFTAQASSTGTFTVGSGVAVIAPGTLTIGGFENAGSFTAPSGMFYIEGNATNTGTFSHNNGTVSFNALGASIGGTFTGTSGFNNFIATTTTNEVVTEGYSGGLGRGSVVDSNNNILYSHNGGDIGICDLSLDPGCESLALLYSTSTTPVALFIDTENGALYFAEGDGAGIYKCILSTNCDADADYVRATSTNSGTLFRMVKDSASSTLYIGDLYSTGIYRCALSTGCDSAGDFTLILPTTGDTSNAIAIDPFNDVLYVGVSNSSGSGYILRCVIATGCDSLSDFATATTTGYAYIRQMHIDETNQVLYMSVDNADAEGLFVIRCSISTTNCDGAGDFSTFGSIGEVPGGIYDGTFVQDTDNGFLYVDNRRCDIGRTSCDEAVDFESSLFTYPILYNSSDETMYGNDVDVGLLYRPSELTFTSAASTSDLTIGSRHINMSNQRITIGGDYESEGTLEAPAQLTVGGNYTNNGTFTNNGGTLDIQAYVKNYIAGIDSSGSLTTTGAAAINTIKARGDYVYIGKDGDGTDCSQVAGSAIGCELMVFDISDAKNPRYVAGRDSYGADTGTGYMSFFDLEIEGNYLYVARQSVSSASCTQVAGTAVSCEILIFDISSSTNPIYVAGRDADGSSTGSATLVSVNDLVVSGGYLYVVKTSNGTACSQVAGSAIGCELMVFNVSNPTNPVYVAGRDYYGTATGTTGSGFDTYTVAKSGNTIYLGTYRDASTACQQSLPSTGCEIKIYDVSDPTSPRYVGGVDSTASSGGSGGQFIADLSTDGNYLYVGKEGAGGACSQSAGSASACEILVFDISSTTNPIYIAGRDVDGAAAGTGNLDVYNIEVANGFMYVGKAGSATACSQVAGSAVGCEYMVFDISSTTNPVYVSGLDMGGSSDGTKTLSNGAIALSGSEVYVGKLANATACSQVAGSAVGCELMILRSSLLSGTMTGSSTLNDFQVTKGVAEFGSVASTTDITLASSSVLVAPTQLTLSGNYLSKGIFVHNGGTTTFSSTTAQTITNTMANTLSFGTLVLSGTSTKTFAGNASTTNLTIQNGVTAVLPPLFSLAGDYVNNGTTTAGTGTTTLNGTTTQTLSGTMTGTSAFNNLAITNTSGAGSSSQSVRFLASASTSDTFSMVASTSVQFLAGATSTFQNIKLSGASGQKVWLRSSTPGTQYGFYVPGTQRDVSYVDAQDNSACPTIILATNGTNVNSGNNTCWTFASAYATVASNADQVFAYLQATTTINPITVTEDASSASITAANDIRLIIATSTTNMRWDTTDVTPTFAGTASGKVSGTVSYTGDGAILIIDVTSDFDPGDTLGVSDLSYARFETVSPASGALGVRTSGAGTSTNNSDSRVVAITGTIAIDSHGNGQIDNAFTSRTVSAGELLAFRLTPGGESFEIADLTFPLKGTQGITTSELSSVYLFRDMNGDGAYDVGDVAVGGEGVVAINGQTGTITFSETFQSTTTQDYILIGSITELLPTDAFILAAGAEDLTSTGITSLIEVTESGGIGNLQHIRGGAGAGGGGSAIGGSAPAGDGVRTGGDQGGGGEIDSNSGDTIGNEVGFRAPTTEGGSWTNGGNAYSSDGAYVTANSSVTHGYGSFGHSVPSNNQVTGIAVKIEASGSTAAGTMSVFLSWDGGSTFTDSKTTSAVGLTDAVFELGGQGDTWGRSWTPAEMNDGNLVVAITANPSGNTIQVDAIQIKVFHQATGGGGGGGGAVFKEPNRYFANVYSAFDGIWVRGMRSLWDFFRGK